MLGNLGVIPLAAHLFIFYFGMMSMVTPPVALAAYAASSIADTRIMPTAVAAFRFALVGFTLPYMFIYRPELLLLNAAGEPAGWLQVLLPVGIATLGVTCFAGPASRDNCAIRSASGCGWRSSPRRRCCWRRAR